MCVSDPLRHLADIVEGIEARAMDVTHVSMSDGTDADGGSVAEVDLTIPFCSAFGDRSTVRLRSSRIADDGSLGLAFETTDPLLSPDDRDVESQLVEAELTDDGSIRALLHVSLPPAVPSKDAPDHAGMDAGASSDSLSDSDAEGNQVEDGHKGTPRTGGSDDVPPFRDRELLAEVYDSCDTFAEMTDALGMDVTAETVRRYMIDHGIHEATPYNTSGGESENTADASADRDKRETTANATGDRVARETDDESDEHERGASSGYDDSGGYDHSGRYDDSGGYDHSGRYDDSDGTGDSTDEVTRQPGVDDGPAEAEAGLEDEGQIVLTDGIGLPDDIEVDRFVEAVKDSRTIYEVTKEIGISREDTVDTLREYNLLDLVGGRLSGGGRSEVTREEVVQRLRECTAEPSTVG